LSDRKGSKGLDQRKLTCSTYLDTAPTQEYSDRTIHQYT